MSLIAWRSRAETVQDNAATYIEQLYRVAFNLTKSKADADDLVQETYVRALDHHDQFKPGTNLKAWLAKILYNLFVNRYHRERKTISIDQPASNEDSIWTDRMVSDAPGPETEILRAELGARLMDALKDLSEEYATTIILVDIGECSYAEVAEIISCPIGTVRSRLFRARSMLAGKLREYV